MIRRFRYQVVTVVAALIALALGIALGGGPLADVGNAQGEAAATSDPARTPAPDATLGERLAGDLARTDLAGDLSGRRIAIVAMPDAEVEQVKSIGSWIETAGGTVTGTYEAGPKLIGPDSKSLVDLLGKQLAEPLGEQVPAGAATYERMGRVMGSAIATRLNPARGAAELDAGSTDILGGLDGAGLLSTSDTPTQRADLVVVVLGAQTDPVDATQADKVVTPLLVGLDAASRGTVVMGDSRSAARGGMLAALRDGDELGRRTSTTDSSELPSGRVIATQALVALTEGRFGDFGTTGADGVTPSAP